MSRALADGSAGSDPRANYSASQLPDACNSPNSAPCIDAAVGYLNRARASLGQGPYHLPSNFNSLTAAEQGFVLANLDRILYGLPPVTGLTAALNRDAAAGVQGDADPHPTAANYTAWTANWAGGYVNMPLAYEAWMYDDGPGSSNLDCTSSNPSGCWGHRHDILWRFDHSGPLAMGVAVGADRSGDPGYAMLLFAGDDTYRPSYVYTWAQAVAAGAPSGTDPGSRPISGVISVPVTAHGPGTVGDGRGHSCHRAACTFREPAGQPVHLTARADRRARFVRWSASCAGKSRGCTTSAGPRTSVGATFSRAR
ncbi:MAG: hypothetical protein M3016_03015 [Actinomycetota bacterium]|nr:hypothetical protein [Actinomycetota bacterium]